MGSSLLMRSSIAAIMISTFVGCGYEATPVSMELRATASDGGPSVPFSLRGTSDPEASAFSTGIMLWTRWATNRDGVRTVELFIDINRDHLPSEVGADDSPEILRGDDQVLAILRGRDSQGAVILEQRATGAQVQVDRLSDSGARQLHQGSFSVTWSPGGAYLDIVGSWQTLPPPASALVGGGGDFTPSPGDSVRTGDSAWPTGDDDLVPFDSAGCACIGEVDEDIPEEPVEPEPEPAPDDTGQGSGGCDCQGDTIDEEPTEPDPEPDTEQDDSGGCDCEGDPGPDEEPAALGGAVGQRVARLRRRCRQGPLRMGMELSPLLFVWGLSAYRRRR